MTGEQVYQRIEKDILLGILNPRERLVEAELCIKLSVSRSLLREVFRRLEGVGLVTIYANRGVAVRDFTLEEIDQIYFVRSLLERAAIPQIIERITDKDIQELQHLNHGFEMAARDADIGKMILVNLSFHRRIWRLAGNAFLYRSLELAQLHTEQMRYICWLEAERVNRSMREHREMLAALAERNASRFAVVVEQQIDGGRDFYQKVLGIQSGAPVNQDGVLAGRTDRPNRVASGQ